MSTGDAHQFAYDDDYGDGSYDDGDGGDNDEDGDGDDGGDDADDDDGDDDDDDDDGDIPMVLAVFPYLLMQLVVRVHLLTEFTFLPPLCPKDFFRADEFDTWLCSPRLSPFDRGLYPSPF